jgi:hypothetical protein
MINLACIFITFPEGFSAVCIKPEGENNDVNPLFEKINETGKKRFALPSPAIAEIRQFASPGAGNPTA